ncbi:GH11869 [Drosophila grimshawi]|uniref:GH11869 n=1 Tax=Drosophila grimshawi TaxID=7222 RepID=B4JLH1_DROGR|nr:GH11869 [Drosophila grimshawi]
MSSVSTNSNSSSSSSSIVAPEPQLATLSYQDEQKSPQLSGAEQVSVSVAVAVAVTTAPPSVVTTQPRTHFTTSHHHYHLPHQFQHPHHQNHHTHSVRVPTPTVPSSYSPSATALDVDGRSPGYGRRAVPLAAPVLSSSLLATSGEAGHVTAAVSPGRMSARSGSQHHVTIDESSLPTKDGVESAGPSGLILGGGDGDGDDDNGRHGNDSSETPSSPGSSSSQHQLGHADGQMALMYHSHQLTNYPVIPAIKRTHRPSFVYPPMPRIKA